MPVNNIRDMQPAQEELRGGPFGNIECALLIASQEQQQAASVTPISAIRRAQLFWQELSVIFEVNEADADITMADATVTNKKRNSAPSDQHPPTEQQQQQRPGSEWHEQQQARAQDEDANPDLQRMAPRKVVILLTRIFDQTFIKPWSWYNQQVDKKDIHLNSNLQGRKSLNIKEKANKVTENVWAEGIVSPKIIKIMVINEVKKDVSKEKKKLEKKQQSAMKSVYEIS
jgi:hypothetical protein